MSELKPQPANDVLKKPQPAKEGLKAQPAKEGVKPPAEESKEELIPPQLPIEKLMPPEVKDFLADREKILFVKGVSKYQNQESLSKFFNLIPPKPEKVIFIKIGQARFIALVYYERADDAENIKRLLSHHCS